VFKAGVQHSYEFTFANSAETPVYDATVYALDAWQNGVKPNKRTSLVVDPPDGRIPPLTPEAQARRRAAARPAADPEGGGGGQKFDGPEDLGLGVRCLTGARDRPPPGDKQDDRVCLAASAPSRGGAGRWDFRESSIAIDTRWRCRRACNRVPLVVDLHHNQSKIRRCVGTREVDGYGRPERTGTLFQSVERDRADEQHGNGNEKESPADRREPRFGAFPQLVPGV